VTTQESTTALPEGIEAANRPFSALIPFGVIAALVAGILLWPSSDENPPAPAAAAVAATPSKSAATDKDIESEPPAKPQLKKDVKASPTSDSDRTTPLRPPPNDACATNAKHWCGKRISHAALIVDVGVRETRLPKRAWVIAVATAMQEATLENLATEKYPVTKDFNFDRKGSDHDSVGIMQQRPSQGWGSPTELMDVRVAAKKFYDKLAKKVKNRKGWENERLTDIAQSVQGSGFPQAYQKHEETAKKIVDLALQYRYTAGYHEQDVRNNWLVMFRCSDPKSTDCRMVPWALIKPIKQNGGVFAKHFPESRLNGDIGDWHHQNAPSPGDHTSADNFCFRSACNKMGWVYAQDFGKGGGFDCNRFVRWLLDELRAHPDKYKEVKYIISTIPGNRSADDGRYYGVFHRRDNWRPTGKDKTDHADHVHISYMPGSERSESTIMADYVKFLNGGANKPVAAPVSGAAAGFPLFMG
jgi:hypothetical protein